MKKSVFKKAICFVLGLVMILEVSMINIEGISQETVNAAVNNTTNDWLDMGMPVTLDSTIKPAIGEDTNGVYYIVVKGTDGNYYIRKHSNGCWETWTSLGHPGQGGGAPSIAVNNGDLMIHIRGSDDALWEMYKPKDGNWGNWSSLGGVIRSNPALYSKGPHKFGVFVIGTDGRIWERINDGNGWNDWWKVNYITTQFKLNSELRDVCKDVNGRWQEVLYGITENDTQVYCSWADNSDHKTAGVLSESEGMPLKYSPIIYLNNGGNLIQPMMHNVCTITRNYLYNIGENNAFVLSSGFTEEPAVVSKPGVNIVCGLALDGKMKLLYNNWGSDISKCRDNGETVNLGDRVFSSSPAAASCGNGADVFGISEGKLFMYHFVPNGVARDTEEYIEPIQIPTDLYFNIRTTNSLFISANPSELKNPETSLVLGNNPAEGSAQFRFKETSTGSRAYKLIERNSGKCISLLNGTVGLAYPSTQNALAFNAFRTNSGTIILHTTMLGDINYKYNEGFIKCGANTVELSTNMSDNNELILTLETNYTDPFTGYTPPTESEDDFTKKYLDFTMSLVAGLDYAFEGCPVGFGIGNMINTVYSLFGEEDGTEEMVNSLRDEWTRQINLCIDLQMSSIIKDNINDARSNLLNIYYTHRKGLKKYPLPSDTGDVKDVLYTDIADVKGKYSLAMQYLSSAASGLNDTNYIDNGKKMSLLIEPYLQAVMGYYPVRKEYLAMYALKMRATQSNLDRSEYDTMNNDAMNASEDIRKMVECIKAYRKSKMTRDFDWDINTSELSYSITDFKTDPTSGQDKQYVVVDYYDPDGGVIPNIHNQDVISQKMLSDCKDNQSFNLDYEYRHANDVRKYIQNIGNRTYGEVYQIIGADNYLYPNTDAYRNFASQDPNAQILEAEKAIVGGKAGFSKENDNSIGSGYVTGFQNKDASSEFKVTTGEKGYYKLKLRYSAGNGDAKNVEIKANDYRYKVICPNTTDWNTWSEADVYVPLHEGDNSITCFADANSQNYINLDSIAIMKEQPTTLPRDGMMLSWEAENLPAVIGAVDGDGRKATVDSPHHYMSYGPYTELVPAGSNTAAYKLKIDNITGENNEVVSIDINNYVTGENLAQKTIYRKDFATANAYQMFYLPFVSPASSCLEFRVFYKGNAEIKLDYVGVTHSREGMLNAWEAENLPREIGEVDADGVKAKIGDPEYCLSFGPYTNLVSGGSNVAAYRLKIDDNTSGLDDFVAVIDVCETEYGGIIAERTLLRRDFDTANKYQTFYLPYNYPMSGPRNGLEFRVRYKGHGNIKLDCVGIGVNGG